MKNIDQEKHDKIAKIAKKYKLELIILFGSFAVGKNRKDSDIDLGILAEKPLDFSREIRLRMELQKIFKIKVDIAILNGANPLLLHQVSINGIKLYGTEKDFFNFKLFSFHRFEDYRPFFALEKKVNKSILKQYAH